MTQHSSFGAHTRLAPIRLRRLGRGDGAAYGQHLLRLPAEDLRVRFFGAVSAEWVRGHAAGAFEGGRIAHGATDGGGALRAAALAVPLPEGAELTVSVEPGFRRLGLGRALLLACCRDAARAGCRAARLPIEPEAPGLPELARALGAAVAEDGRVAVVALPPP